MSSEEEKKKLYARAEMLEETQDLAQAVAEVLQGAQGAGVDPQAVIRGLPQSSTPGSPHEHWYCTVRDHGRITPEAREQEKSP